MDPIVGWFGFFLAPPLLAGVLVGRFAPYRRVRLGPLVIYVLVMGGLIGAALGFVGHVAVARVAVGEVLLVLWFTIAWRLAWTLWSRTVGRWGQRWVRWARLRRRRGRPAPRIIRLIPIGRAAITLLVFVPAFLSTILTHRCKLQDGQDPALVYGRAFDTIRIPTADGLTLDAWFIPEPSAQRTIIVCHGAGANKGNFVGYLGPLVGHGYNVVFFDFRAHGASEGRTTTWGIRERLDVRAVVDWLKRERPEQARVIVGLGSSQGAMALALAAAEDPRIDAVVLDSPFVSARELAHHHARRVPVLGPAAVDWVLLAMSIQTPDDFFTFSAERAVRQLGTRPVMIVHGDEDFGMPASHAQRLYAAAPGPREIWFGPGPHSNIITVAPSDYARRLFGFLEAHLAPSDRLEGMIGAVDGGPGSAEARIDLMPAMIENEVRTEGD